MNRPLKWILGLVIVLALSSLGAAAWANTTTVYVIWQPTVGGSWTGPVTSGTIGGAFYVRVREETTGMYRPGMPTGEIEESSAPHATTPYTLTFSGSTPNSNYNDPPGSIIYEALVTLPNQGIRPHWASYAIHNVSVTYVDTSTNPPGIDTQTPSSISVTIHNMKVTDTTTGGTVFLWDPDTSTSMDMSCDLAHAQSGEATVRYDIYDTTDEDFDPATHTITNQDVDFSGSDSASWTPSTMPPLGVYTYAITSEVEGPAYHDIETSRARIVTRALNAQSQPITSAISQGTVPGAEVNLYDIYYKVTDSEDMEDGEITLYGPEDDGTALEVKETWDIADLPCVSHSNDHDGLDASSSGITHALRIPVLKSKLKYCKTYFFVISGHSGNLNNMVHANYPILEMGVRMTIPIPDCEDLACGGDSGGGGCNTCGPGGPFVAPVPNLLIPKVEVPVASYLGGAPASAANLGPDGCPESRVKVYDCDTTKIAMFWTPCGECSKVVYTGESTFPSKKPLGNQTFLEKQSSSGTSDYKYYDAAGGVWDYSTPDPIDNVCWPETYTDADGKVTTFTRDATTKALISVTFPDGTIWYADHATGDTKTNEFTAPNGGTYEIQYSSTGFSLGKPTSIVQKDDQGTTLTTTTFTYYASTGRLESVTNGDHTVSYAYSPNSLYESPTTIAVTDESTDPEIVTEYSYATDTTTVTRKHNSSSSLDQVTEYAFFTKSNKKTYLWKVTDPYDNESKSGTYVPTGTDTTGKTVDVDYKVSDDPDLVGKVFRSEDKLGNVTEYTYNDTTGTVAEIEYADDSTQTYTYYNDSQSNPTSFVRTVKDVRGNYTHYVRSSSSLWQVDAMKISAPVSGAEPTNWSGITAAKEYVYYPDNDEHDQDDKLWKERVADVDGSEDYEVIYRYYETVNGNEVLRSKPTRTEYKYWNGSAYTTKYSTTSYDDMGHAVSTTDANSRTVTYTYDAQGRQLKAIYQTSPEIASESNYTCCGLNWTKDPDGRETHYKYDDAGRMTDTWTSLSGQSDTHPLIHHTYDAFGNKAAETTYSDSSTGRQASYTYDKNNRVTAIDNPSPLGDEEFGYDDAGNLLWKEDGIVSGTGVVTLYRYDELNRLTNVYYNYTGALPPTSYPGTADVTYTYDGGSQLKDTMVDASGTSSYSYDERGRLTAYTPPKPNGQGSVTYGYNNLNQKTSVSIDSLTTNYAYYANGWLKDVRRGTTLVAGYTYDYMGNRTRVDYGNSTYQTYSFEDDDPRYRLNMIEYAYRCSAQESVAVQGSLRLTRDNAGNPLSWSAYDTSTPAANIYGKTYTYDQNSRLGSAAYPGQSTIDYTYDWVGNRLGTGFTYNAADQMTASPGKSYTYDGNGNMLTGTMAFSYSPTNLVTEAGSTDMAWDSMGNRVSFTTSGSATYQFVYDPTAGIPAVVEEVTTGGSVYYIREPDGELIARITGTGENQTTTYYHFDELGSTLFLTDPDGILSDKYTYDAWGNVTSHVGSTQQPYQFVGQLGYYTHYQETGFKLLQLGVRLYDPEMGRFTHRDPAEDDHNRFIYVGSAPTRFVDPSGLFREETTEACKQYDQWCRQGMRVACRMAPICRSFGNDRWSNCVRGCLLEKYAKCAQMRGWRRRSCEAKYLGPGHAACFAVCSAYTCQKWAEEGICNMYGAPCPTH